MFFQYDFDKLLMNNLANLLTYGKAYVEVVKLFDKDNKLVGIKLLAFRNNIQISLGDKIYYFLRRYDCRIAFYMLLKSLEIFKINKRQALLSWLNSSHFI